MSDTIVQDILQTEIQAQERYAHALAERDTIISQAREDAMQLIQQAEGSFGSERERAIATQDRALHERKSKIIAEANAEGARIVGHIESKLPLATKQLLKRFREHVNA